MTDILDKLKKILKNEFDIEEEITLDKKFSELEMDDLDIVDFITLIEDEFDIEMPSYNYENIDQVVKDILKNID